ncbi:MAG: hypothetical protein PHS64_03045 [Candidatus Omnitrophica bacterium]|nr:hypothetical protein [Candidatus Omnitrophota bacterium]
MEKWAPGYTLPPRCTAVALTPIADYQLDMAGIQHASFADFFSSGQIRGDVDAYLDSQLSWFNAFDQFTMKLYPDAQGLRLRLPSLFFHNIKYMVDCIVLSARIMTKFIEMTRPEKLWFSPRIYGDDKVGRWEFFSFGESPFFRLAPLICKKAGIPFERLAANDDDVSSDRAGEPARGISPSRDVRPGINAVISKMRAMKKWVLRYACLLSGFKLNRRLGNASVFVVREFPYTNAFYRDAISAGFKVYYKEDEAIRRLDWLDRSPGISFKDRQSAQHGNPADGARATDELARGSIMRWINEQCGVDVTDVFYSRFKFYLEEVFPETIARVKKYVTFYEKYHIDFVVSFAISTIDDFAAVAAAKVSGSCKSVCFAHGADALALRSSYFKEYCHFDYFMVMTAGEAAHIRVLAAAFNNRSIKVGEYSYFRDQFRRYQIKKPVDKDTRRIVLYIPIMKVERMNMPIDNCQSLQWDYFEWHKALIKYFSSRNDFLFIWKVLLQYDRAEPVADMIKDAGASNIVYSAKGIREWLPRAQRALCDMPSTAFYECIFSRVPVLALYRPGDQSLHKDAYVSYVKILKPYSTVQEGIDRVEKYLNDKAGDYLLTQTRENVFMPDFLYNKDDGERV